MIYLHVWKHVVCSNLDAMSWQMQQTTLEHFRRQYTGNTRIPPMRNRHDNVMKLLDQNQITLMDHVSVVRGNNLVTPNSFLGFRLGWAGTLKVNRKVQRNYAADTCFIKPKTYVRALDGPLSPCEKNKMSECRVCLKHHIFFGFGSTFSNLPPSFSNFVILFRFVAG